MTHSTLRALTLVIALFAVFGGSAFAQNQASATANASATIVTPLSLAKTTDMDFSEVAAGSTSGTIVLSTSGGRTATGGTKVGQGTGVAAVFGATGQAGYTINITLPSSAVTLTSGANTMTVTNFTSNPSGSTTLSGGSATINVGGTLNVGANQAAGTYTGTFSVTVAYP